MDDNRVSADTDGEAQRAALKQVQDKLTELDNIYRSAYVGLGVLDSKLRYIRVNERLAEINGIPAADHIGRTIREVIPAKADAAEKLGRHIIATGKPELNVEFHGTTLHEPDKERVWTEHWMPITDNTGAVAGINVVVHEITEIKQAEALLRQSRDKIEAIHNGMLDGLLITDAETRRFVRVNPQMCQMLGYSEDELLSMSVEQIHPPAELQEIMEHFRAAKEGR